MTTSTDRRGGPRHERQYPEPTSLDDAYRRRDALATAIIEIEGQLARRNRLDPETGRRLTAVQYGQWRDRANEARVAKTNEIRYLKQWIREARAKATTAAPPTRPSDIREAVWSPAMNRAYWATLSESLRRRFHEAALNRPILHQVDTLVENGQHVGDVLLAALLQAEGLVEEFQTREATRLSGVRVGSGFGGGGAASGPDGGSGYLTGAPLLVGGSTVVGTGAGGGRSGWEDAGAGDTRAAGDKDGNR